jgi:hypothetical protein
VSFKRNAKDDLVFAVIVPAVRLPARVAGGQQGRPRKALGLWMRAPSRGATTACCPKNRHRGHAASRSGSNSAIRRGAIDN